MEEEYNEAEFEQLTTDIDLAFPNCPFAISCVNKIEELDIAFTKERVMMIGQSIGSIGMMT